MQVHPGLTAWGVMVFVREERCVLGGKEIQHGSSKVSQEGELEVVGKSRLTVVSCIQKSMPTSVRKNRAKPGQEAQDSAPEKLFLSGN